MEVIKTTALLYLQDALQKQEFEKCKELIDAAKANGAQQSEISEAIAMIVRGDKPGGKSGAAQYSNRVRSLK